MLNLLREEVKIGDQIKLYLVSGQEPIGEVLEISETYVRIKSSDNQESRFFEKLIGGWEVLEKTAGAGNLEKLIESELPNNQDSHEEPIVLNTSATSKAESEVKGNKEVEPNIESKEVGKTPSLRGLKVIGKIDLDKIDSKGKKSKTVSRSSHNSIRLIRAAKSLEISMDKVVDLAEELSITILSKSNFPIPEDDYKKIKNYYFSTTQKQRESSEVKKPNSKKLVLKSLDDLKGLKTKITIEEGKQFLPPNGIIKRYGKSGFGFISDKENKDYYFRFTSVVDKELRDRIISSNSEIGTQIICQFNNRNGRLSATDIRLSEPIENLYQIAISMYDNGDDQSGQDLLLMILDSFPDYSPARDLLNKIKYDRDKAKKSKINASNSYFRARTELSRGNIDEAKKHFEGALDLTDHRAENVVKELAYLYQREGHSEKAIELVKKSLKKFKSSDPNSFIAFFYESDKKYDLAVEYLEKVKPGSRNDNIKLTKRKANAYYRINKYDKAENLIKEVLKDQPDDRISQKILEGLEQAKISGKYEQELETIFNEAELTSFSGGLSPYTQYALDRCELDGIPPSDVRDENFNETTLKQLRNIIERLGSKRPKDRASFLLTEAKLIELIDSDSESEKLSALTKYYLAFCDHMSTESQPVDVIRFFLIEASRTSKRIDNISNHIPVYFYSFFENSNEAQKWKESKIDSSLLECLDIDHKEVWQGLADLFLTNSHVFSTLLSRLFSNNELKNRSVEFLGNFLKRTFSPKVNQKEFKEAWSIVVEKRQLAKQSIYGKFLSLNDSVSSEQFAESFNIVKNDNVDFLNQTDRFRIKSIDDINDNVFEFNRQHDFEDKERMHNQLQNNITQLCTDIENSPTEFSFNVLRNVLSTLSKLAHSEFTRLVDLSSPVLDIQIAGEGILNQDQKSVTFQVLVSNKKGSAPISSFELSSEKSEEFNFHNDGNISEQTLKGGEERPMKLSLTMASKSTELSAFGLTIICTYKIRGSEETKLFSKPLALRFYSEKEFERIENPFATTADSGPVEDPTMFFGRDEFLNNVTESVLGSGAKCIIIYGQKRSGKSSVLFHLKERLNNTTNTFCIQFSLGEIIDDLSSEVFYYKVLSEIEDTLDILREDGFSVPQFESTSLQELSSAPSIIFNERLKSLKKQMSKTKGWSDKKLVLLLDEFTYIYTAIKRGILSDQFMKSWKSFLEKGHFTSVLIGQDIMPKFTSTYPNEFGVTEPRRLSYLRKSDAKELIEKPVWDIKRDRSRFLGNALELILDYTSSNPYYIQIFCARLIEHMNRTKAITVTEADVKEIADSFISGADALTADKFDNLITAGDAEVESFPPDQVLLALKEIAIATKNLPSCSRESIKNQAEITDDILDDLKSREVIDCPQPGYYKINVRLFKEWLLKN